ncbi:MAG: SCP2 sterol-binding domain-containing protein [Alphaproteobacteria bacterium]
MANSESSGERLEELCGRLRSVLADVPPLGAVIEFDLGADGRLLVDARRRPPDVTPGSGAAACTLSMRLETLERVLAGEIDGTTAFMQGEMTISGDVELAVRLNELLARAVAGADGAPPG